MGRNAALTLAIAVALSVCFAPQALAIDLTKIDRTIAKIISPQAILDSLSFSPDGKFLATSGHGEVLLSDFSVPPGEKHPDK